MIKLKNIKKRYGKAVVLDDIDLEIRRGETFGLLGVNGAGKTTLIRILLGLAKVTSGDVEFEGRVRLDSDVQKHVGFLPENFLPPKNLKSYEFLKILSLSFGLKSKDIRSLLELVGLKDAAKKYIRTFSRGMIQRLGLATCLLKNPQILILDEPALGLDPLGQKQVIKLLADLNRQGKTIFFSSHILSHIEELCSRIGIIHKGVIKFVGPVNELTSRHQSKDLEGAFLAEIL